MKRHKRILPMLFLAALLLSGCMPTPEEPIVIGKNNEVMIEKALAPQESAAPAALPVEGPSYAQLCARYGAPERWQLDISEVDGKLSISADVALTLPQSLVMPMARVTAANFEQPLVSAMFHYLCGDTPMYLHPKVMNKAAVMDYMLDLQEFLATIDREKSPQVAESVERQIRELQKQYETAPEEAERTPTDGTLLSRNVDHNGITDASTGTVQSLSAVSEPYSDAAMTFSVSNNIHYENTEVYSWVDEDGNTQVVTPISRAYFGFYRKGYQGDVSSGSPVMDVTEASLSGEAVDSILQTTPASARAAVDGFLAAVGIDGMLIDRVELYTDRMDYWNHPEDKRALLEAEQAAKPEQQAYVFRLLRSVNGVMTESNFSSSETLVNGAAFGWEWSYETCEIAVDDGGILSISWTGPLTIDEVLTENAALLPFSDIEETFKKLMVVKNAPNAKDDFYKRITYTVDRAELCLWRIIDKNSFTNGILVPVWNFYCTTLYEYHNGEPDTIGPGPIGYGDSPMLTINAVDGSVIDIQQGY